MNRPGPIPGRTSTPVRLKPDTLDAENRRFVQTPLERPVFLNSVPKSGSHLLRNIIRMFVPVEQQYQVQFIQWGNLQEHKQAFDPARPMLSWGHLLFSDASAVEAARARKIVLVRDPYDWVLARARFFLSDEFGDNAMLVKNGEMSVDALVNLMIFGIHGKAMSLRDLFTFNAVAWLGSDCTMIRYEDIVAALKDLASEGTEVFFRRLLVAAGIDTMPGDWRERVAIGADRRQSGTARENLSPGAITLPDTLGEHHRALVDFAAPGLRPLLGYR